MLIHATTRRNPENVQSGSGPSPGGWSSMGLGRPAQRRNAGGRLPGAEGGCWQVASNGDRTPQNCTLSVGELYDP